MPNIPNVFHVSPDSALFTLYDNFRNDPEILHESKFPGIVFHSGYPDFTFKSPLKISLKPRTLL
jgi:hypothetical protein